MELSWKKYLLHRPRYRCQQSNSLPKPKPETMALNVHPAPPVNIALTAPSSLERSVSRGAATTRTEWLESNLALEPVELGPLLGPDSEIRTHLPLDEAPHHLVSALLISEDKKSYEHWGVNSWPLCAQHL